MDYFELKLSEVRLKGSFELFTGLEQNLVKPRTKIKLGKPSGITQFIEQLINNRHRILAFLCNSIKLTIVNAKSPCVILFLDQ